MDIVNTGNRIICKIVKKPSLKIKLQESWINLYMRLFEGARGKITWEDVSLDL